MSQFRKTIFFAIFTIVLTTAVYFLDYKSEEKSENQRIEESQILKLSLEQINYLEITKKEEKIILQKSEKGWSILEPLQDKADNDQIDELLLAISKEKVLAIAKKTELDTFSQNELAEYGLDQPLVIYNIKNNLGQKRRIAVGTQKNFEGNSFLRIDNEKTIFVANNFWFNKAEQKLIYYRDKRLYRGVLADVKRVKITSLNQEFELTRNSNIWSPLHLDYVLDQSKVNDFLRKISEAVIQDYIFDGEPSQSLLAEKGILKKPYVKVEFFTSDGAWSTQVNIHEADNAVYALTDRPTRLVKLNASLWEFFGNMNLDSLRDRVSVTRFNIANVKKIFFKYQKKEFNFIKLKDQWNPVETIAENIEFDEKKLIQTLNKIHDLEISEFIDKKQVSQFQGKEMIILKSETDNLVYQLNWGPEFKMKKNEQDKNYFYARTQVSSSIFALEKEKIEGLGLDQILKQKDIK